MYGTQWLSGRMLDSRPRGCRFELSTAKTYEHNRLDETSIVDRHRCHMAAKFGLFVDEDHSKLPTLYRLPKLHKWPYKSRFIANSSA